MNDGWRWAFVSPFQLLLLFGQQAQTIILRFRFCAIGAGVNLVLNYLFMPETRYHRADLLSTLKPQGSDNDFKGTTEAKEDYPREVRSEIPAKKTFVQELAIFSGIHPTRNSILMLLAQPFILLFSPGLIWAGIVYGLGITWIVLLATSL
jgi:hypothetical protein